MNNSKSIMVVDSKFNPLQRVNSQKLSLADRSIRISSPKKMKTVTFPGIGHMFVMDLIAKTLEAPLANATPEKTSTNLMNSSVNSKSRSLPKSIKQTLKLRDSKRNSESGANKQNLTIERAHSEKKQTSQKPLLNSHPIKTPLKLPRKFSLKRTLSYAIESDGIFVNRMSTETQTDAIQLSKQSYDEYVRFKITQKEKFEKFKDLFNFIQNLAHLESKNFKSNIESIEQIFSNQTNLQREKRIDDLMKDLSESSSAFASIFKQTFSKQKKIMKEFSKNQSQFQNLIKKLFKQVQDSIIQMMIQKEIFRQTISHKDIKEAFSSILRKQDKIFEENKTNLNQKLTEFQKNVKQMQEKYDLWQKSVIQQSTLIKNCVLSIIQLPELSIGLFGSHQFSDHNHTNNEIKNYCVNNKAIPHISDFFMKKGDAREAEINQFFGKCCQIKCMNCIYIRSKMKYIYEKNNELKPIIKALITLTKCEPKDSIIHKNLLKLP